MKPFLALLAAAGLISIMGTPVQASWLSSSSDEITPLQYSALLGLRDVDPELFRVKLLPLIDEAMKDGRITVGELGGIERAAGNVAKAFYRAAKAPTFQESLNQSVDKAQKEGKDLGNRLEESLSGLPGLMDDAIKMFRNQFQQYKKENPEPPTAL